VILVRVPEGFVAELTYGEDVNWYRNIVAAGGCVVVHHRREYRIDSIEPCSAERGLSAYPFPFRQVLKAAGRDQFRLLRTASQPSPLTGRLMGGALRVPGDVLGRAGRVVDDREPARR